MSTQDFVNKSHGINADMRDSLSQLRGVSQHLFGFNPPEKDSPGIPRAPAGDAFFEQMEDAQLAELESHNLIVREINHIMEHLGMLDKTTTLGAQTRPSKPFTGRTMPAVQDPDGLIHPRPISPQEERERLYKSDRDLEETLSTDLAGKL